MEKLQEIASGRDKDVSEVETNELHMCYSRLMIFSLLNQFTECVFIDLKCSSDRLVHVIILVISQTA